MLYGGILIIAGEFFLMSPGVAGFYAGLGLLIFGTGLLKPNASTMVGLLYADGDRRRDSGFSIYYMGINLGALLSPLACGYVGERISWRLGFGLAGLGMVVGLVQYLLGAKNLGSAGLHPAPPASPEEGRRIKRNAALAALGAVVLLGAVGRWRSAGNYRSDRAASIGGAGNCADCGIGGDFRVAVAGTRLVADGTQAIGRHAGAVSRVRDLLGSL